MIDGKSGVDIFKPTSRISDYVAAGVTALISGTGVGGALARSVAIVAIQNVEKQIRDEDVDALESLMDITLGTVVDLGVGKISDSIDEVIDKTGSPNYSSYAGKKYKKNPGITPAEIRTGLRNQVKIKSAVKITKNIIVEMSRTLLPY